MNQAAWSDDDRNEYDLLIDKALSISSVPVRVAVFLEGLEAALAARRLWARDVHADFLNEGANRLLKAEQDKRRARFLVSHLGEVIGKMPHTAGARRRSPVGRLEHQRVLIEMFTWDELRARRREYAAQAKALEVNVKGVDRLLELEERVPSAANPEEACAALGTTVREWLASEGISPEDMAV